MNDSVIKVEKLSKAYRIGMKEQKHDTMGAALVSWIKSPINNFLKLRKLSTIDPESNDSDIFWALRDLNFEVKRGEVLGIIGKNGAGKSTLLKILSRITEPTYGQAEISGRVASLLEVGTGFHPELTGRENVYLNGTILGMTKKEIDHKFEEIVDFSGVEQFIDTPVKRYSSGMKVRLAFSVAAHLEPEILIIDEVLAVGDAEFQRKCLGKMKDVSNTGRTVLFVSHNLAAVNALCNEAIVLKNGKILLKTDTQQAVSFYQKDFERHNSSIAEWAEEDAPGDHRAKLLKVEVKPLKGDSLNIASGIKFIFTSRSYLTNAALDISYNLTNQDGVLMLHHGKQVSTIDEMQPGLYRLEAEIPPYTLNEGEYSIDVWMGLNGLEIIGAKLNYLITFYIENSKIDHIVKKLPGIIRPLIKYRTIPPDDFLKTKSQLLH